MANRAARAIWALTYTLAMPYVRGWRGAVLVLLMPVFFEIVMGLAYKYQAELVNKPLQVAIVAGASGNEQRSALHALPNIRYQSLNLRDAKDAIASGRILFAFDAVSSGSRTRYTIYSAPRGFDFARLVVSALNGRAPAIKPVVVPLSPRTNFFGFVFGGLLCLALFQICLVNTASTVLQSRVTGQLRHLYLTPMHPIMPVAAHFLVRLALSAIVIGVMVAVGQIFFDIAAFADYFGFVLRSVGIALISVCLGFALGGMINSAFVGQYVFSLLTFTIMGFGQIFVQYDGRSILATISNFLPFSYMAAALRESVLGIASPYSLLASIGVPAIWSITLTAICIRTFNSTAKD